MGSPGWNEMEKNSQDVSQLNKKPGEREKWEENSQKASSFLFVSFLRCYAFPVPVACSFITGTSTTTSFSLSSHLIHFSLSPSPCCCVADQSQAASQHHHESCHCVCAGLFSSHSYKVDYVCKARLCYGQDSCSHWVIGAFWRTVEQTAANLAWTFCLVIRFSCFWGDL